ncbi:AMP-dependent synthetase, partial [Rhodomicrobium udaipurense JA643]
MDGHQDPQVVETNDKGTQAGTAAAIRPWLRSYPAGVDWFQVFEPKPLPVALEETVARFPDKPASWFFGKTMTYAELGAAVDRATKALQGLGVREGTRVGLLFPNCPAFVIFYYATLKAGGTVVSLNPLYTVPELAYQVKDAGVKIVVTADLAATLPKAKALVDNGTLETVIVAPFKKMLPGLKGFLFGLFKGKDLAKWTPGRGLLSAEELLDNDGHYDRSAIDVNAVAALQYTGGTTGTPKGAMLTHANLSINVQQAAAWFPGLAIPGEERFFCVIPFFHSFAMTGLMNFAILKGAQMIMLPRFELKLALKTIDQTKPTIMAGVPTLFNAMAKVPDIKKHDLSSLKFCISGGAALPLEVRRDFESVSGCGL